MGFFNKLKRELNLDTSKIENFQHDASNMFSQIFGQLKDLKKDMIPKQEKRIKSGKSQQKEVCKEPKTKIESSQKFPNELAESINESAKALVSNYLEAFSNTEKIIMSTTDVYTFFSRYELFDKHFNRLVENLKKHSELSGVDYFETFSISKLYQDMLEIVENKEANLTLLIQRWYHKIIEEASSLKTEKGRKNRISRCFEEMRSFSDQFSAENKALLEDLEKQAINSISL